MKDLHSVEKQLVNALLKMAKPSTDEKLAAGFEEHLAQTEEQISNKRTTTLNGQVSI